MALQSDIELAWAAGFFDGEGCFGAYLKRKGGRTYGRISIAQCDPQVLERFQKAIGYGVIKGPTQQRENWSPRWDFIINSQSEVREVCAKLRPHLSPVKVAQMDQMLYNIEDAQNPDRKRLTPQQVDALMADWESRQYTRQQIANKYNMKYGAVQAIIHRKTHTKEK